MDWIGSMRCAIALFLVGGGVAPGQMTPLPATAPTTLPAAGRDAALAARGVASPMAAAETAAHGGHLAKVHSVAGKVEVVADGSSLNLILREIGRVTGMKISGNVADEPVYGSYGPAPVSEILSTLLDGTASNMLLREATAEGPGELILTPRTGKATPPDPNAQANQNMEEVPPNVPGSPNYQRPREAWMGPLPANNATTGGSGGQGGGAPDRPNPQQIYQRLQQLQQSQQSRQEPQQKPQE